MIIDLQASAGPAAVSKAASDCREIAQNALSAARRAQQSWASSDGRQRRAIFRKTRRVMADRAVLLAQASAQPRSRPVEEVLMSEVMPLLEALRYLEQNASSILQPRKLKGAGALGRLGLRRVVIAREPFGTVLIIGPGNYPLFLAGVQALQALAAGNAVVVKPGCAGTRPVELLRSILLQAGLSPELFQILPESAEAARAAIEARPDKVLFTGSAPTGEKIVAQCARELIPSTMELSGCDALMVRADADLDLVVSALEFSLTLNAGGTCIGPKRLFVDRRIATELEGRLSRRFAQHASWIARCPQAGPFIGQAIAEGAHLISGAVKSDGQIQVPLILGGVPAGTSILHNDLFASVLSVVTVGNDAEAVDRANECPYALGASIFSRDESVAQRIAEKINAGVVTVNDVIVPTADPRVPFGGRGRSGYGVTRGAEGLLELTRPKVVTVSGGRRRPAFNAPSRWGAELFAGLIKLSHGDLRSRWRGFVSIIQSLRKKEGKRS